MYIGEVAENAEKKALLDVDEENKQQSLETKGMQLRSKQIQPHTAKTPNKLAQKKKRMFKSYLVTKDNDTPFDLSPYEEINVYVVIP